MENASNKDHDFKGQYPDEEVMAFFRHHWITLVPNLLMMGFVFFALGIFAVRFARMGYDPSLRPFFQGAMVLAVPILTYLLHTFFLEIIKHFLQTVIITNHRIVEIKRTILMKDDLDSLLIEVIQDVKKEQEGLLKNIFDFGDLIIIISSDTVKKVHYVPNPNYHFRLINRVKQNYKKHPEHGWAGETHTTFT